MFWVNFFIYIFSLTFKQLFFYFQLFFDFFLQNLFKMTEPTSSRNESIYDETDPDIELKPKKSIVSGNDFNIKPFSFAFQLRPVPSNPSTNAIIFAMFGNGTWSYLATFGMTGRSGLSLFVYS